MVKGIIPYAHHLLKSTINKGDFVVDATCGNGNDTLFLTNLVGESGHVYAFDVQAQAIETSKALLKKNGKENVTYIHDSHANIEKYIPILLRDKIGGAVFNLGYLPRSDKQIITQGDSTIAAINALLPFFKKGAVIVIVIYYGHEGGLDEKNEVLQYAKQLDQNQFTVLQYEFINQKNNPPFVVAIEKR